LIISLVTEWSRARARIGCSLAVIDSITDLSTVAEKAIIAIGVIKRVGAFSGGRGTKVNGTPNTIITVYSCTRLTRSRCVAEDTATQITIIAITIGEARNAGS
jgi:hypothetical protein